MTDGERRDLLGFSGVWDLQRCPEGTERKRERDKTG